MLSGTENRRQLFTRQVEPPAAGQEIEHFSWPHFWQGSVDVYAELVLELLLGAGMSPDAGCDLSRLGHGLTHFLDTFLQQARLLRVFRCLDEHACFYCGETPAWVVQGQSKERESSSSTCPLRV